MDNCTPAGDALVRVPAWMTRSVPARPSAAAAVTNAIKCRIAEKLIALGKPPIVLTSSYFIGERGQPSSASMTVYDDYRARVQKVSTECRGR